MSKTVEAVFFDMLHLSIVFAGAFAGVLHGSTSLKTSPSGRKRVRAGTTLFAELQRRVGPDG
jgi:hypothetical protein